MVVVEMHKYVISKNSFSNLESFRRVLISEVLEIIGK